MIKLLQELKSNRVFFEAATKAHIQHLGDADSGTGMMILQECAILNCNVKMIEKTYGVPGELARRHGVTKHQRTMLDYLRLVNHGIEQFVSQIENDTEEGAEDSEQ